MVKSHTTQRVLVLSDIHAPFQDEQALSVAKAFQKDFRPHITIALGDWIDSSAFSTHAKDIENFDQLDEYLIASQLLDDFKPQIWIDGNHEDRLFRPGNIPQSYRRLLDHRKWLRFKERGIKHHPYSSHEKHIYKLGKLSFVHGFSAGQYAAARAASRYGSVVLGHTHRLQIVQLPHASYKHTGFNIGCLCRLDQNYTKTWDPHGWGHGFGYGYVYKSGNFTFNVARLIGDKIHLEGKEYALNS